MTWRWIIFDFDDTIYLKTNYEFIPKLSEIILRLRLARIPIGILTYNNKAMDILKNAGLLSSFEFVITIASKREWKSQVFQRTEVFKKMNFSKKNVLFFDNDPFNVYDMKKLGFTSFLVNPVIGLSQEFLEMLLGNDFERIKNNILKLMPKTYNYVERTTYTQNLSEIDSIIS